MVCSHRLFPKPEQSLYATQCISKTVINQLSRLPFHKVEIIVVHLYLFASDTDVQGLP